MIGDPIPWRHRKPYHGGGVLTKAEMAGVVQILNDAKSEKNVYRHPGQSEDLWTAFVSLLKGGYIREADSRSQKYVLTNKGKAYLESL